ncbi:MAG: GntR family transcriptional regulator [Solirubrobacteraceae bacterium]|nr:GntR family transcriptional regulator [Solirubrobacteraceae bacterium]
MTDGSDAQSVPNSGLGPATTEVLGRLVGDIADGVLKPGQRLGTERELAASYGVSRSTLRDALEALESRGAVRRVSGRGGGTFVADRKVERDLTSYAGLPAFLRRQGFASGARVLSTATVEADAETGAALGVPPGTVVLEIARVRLANGEPISLERARFPAERFPGLLDHPLGGSLYELLADSYGLRQGEAEERIEVVGAGVAEARLLGVRRSAPLMSVVRTTKDAAGVPFEHSHDLFRADRVRIIMRARAEESRVGVAVKG